MCSFGTLRSSTNLEPDPRRQTAGQILPPQMSHSISRSFSPSIFYFGTPVAVLSTSNHDGWVNLTPMSSAWALGDRIILGLSVHSQGYSNLVQTGEVVVNLPDASAAEALERIAPTTGAREVPAHKAAMGYRFERDKFALAGWSEVPSSKVRPPRIAQCPIQLECRLLQSHAAKPTDADPEPGFRIFEVEVVQAHAHEKILWPATDHVNTERWKPLLYVFRHYFSTGDRLGRNFRAAA
ncbi:flavin reductase family protein [Ramlibacter algicola]|uniref:Flavin reductase family protein n=1 Tax=Ramlibacter algicola TaxID=2795217 RepID=A0A934PY51_9BURK|nr:flavin reductase family protein [Ramlibacter algicola]MBK0392690.1 flavin reductase family protein [Ramlibacter algicola]